MVNAYSLIISFPFENMLLSSDRLSIGANISYNTIDQTENLVNVFSDNYDFSGFPWSVGLIYDYNTTYNVGLYFEKGNDIKHEFSNGLFLETKFRDKLHIGMKVHPIKNWDIYGNISKNFWNDEKINNHFDFSSGLIYKPLANLSASLGFFTDDMDYKQKFYYIVPTSMDALFLTAGVRLNLKKLQIDFLIADSHTYSSKYRKQTILKLAIGYSISTEK